MTRWPAIVTCLLLGARALVDALRTRAELAYHQLFQQSFREPAMVAPRMAETEADLHLLEQVADGLLAGTALAFAGWLFLRYRALPERRRPAHWALWVWLVPGLNLIEPYRLVRELWAGGAEGARERAPWLVFGWWCAWLGYLLAILGVMAAEARAGALLGAGQPLEAFVESLRAVRIGVAVAALSCLAALLGVGVVAGAERRLNARG